MLQLKLPPQNNPLIISQYGNHEIYESSAQRIKEHFVTDPLSYAIELCLTCLALLPGTNTETNGFPGQESGFAEVGAGVLMEKEPWWTQEKREVQSDGRTRS